MSLASIISARAIYLLSREICATTSNLLAYALVGAAQDAV